MKKFTFLSALALTVLSFSYSNSFAQEICLVSADYDNAEKYFVVWEKPLDPENYDSVFIYRKMDPESVFTKIGGTSMNDDFSFFLDTASNTITTTFYRISFRNNFGIESAPSPWHRPVIMDYIDGTLTWTLYEKENQVDESWVAGYACLRDETGLGLYTTMGYWETSAGATQTSWFDQEAPFNTDFIYQMGVDLPNCSVTRANINTSRSNIKRQYANDEVSVQETPSNTNILISPNPIIDWMNIQVDANFSGDNYLISDASGKIINSGVLSGKSVTIDLSKIQNGVYFFTVVHQDKNYSKIFMKN
jgi:hypothetical protein